MFLFLQNSKFFVLSIFLLGCTNTVAKQIIAMNFCLPLPQLGGSVRFTQSSGAMVGSYTQQRYFGSSICSDISNNTVLYSGCYYNSNYNIGPYRELEIEFWN
jgi:hypothetical protein